MERKRTPIFGSWIRSRFFYLNFGYLILIFIFLFLKAAPAIEFLLKSYPNYVTVDELPMETIEEKVI